MDYIEILKEEYEKQYSGQKYEDSILCNTFQEVLLNAMHRCGQVQPKAKSC